MHYRLESENMSQEGKSGKPVSAMRKDVSDNNNLFSDQNNLNSKELQEFIAATAEFLPPATSKEASNIDTA